MRSSLLFLGIIKKAGRIEIGDESVKTAAREGKARLIVTASDAAGNLKDRCRYYAESAGIPTCGLPFTKSEIGCVIGRGLPACAAITDIRLAYTVVDKLAAEAPDDVSYKKCRESLKERLDAVEKREKEWQVHLRNKKIGKRRNQI